MLRQQTYLHLEDEMFEQLNKYLKLLGFKNKTEYFTACAEVLLCGINPIEWNKNLHEICEKKNLMQKTFFEILDEKAFPIIAMKGTKTVISPGILNDIKRDILNRCDMLPEDRELENWLETYRQINNTKLAEHRARVTKERFEEEEEYEEDNA